MGNTNMVDELCIECGRPLDDDDLCEACLREVEVVMEQRFRPHLIDDRDGKRLAKSRRPKHKPTPDNVRAIPIPPKVPRPEHGSTAVRRPTNRPRHQADARSHEGR